MGGFIVAMLISFFAPTAVYGRIGYIAVAFLIVALVAFALIYFDNKERRQQQEAQQAEKQRRADARAVAPLLFQIHIFHIFLPETKKQG